MTRDIIERLALSENELEMMEHSIAEMEKTAEWTGMRRY